MVQTLQQINRTKILALAKNDAKFYMPITPPIKTKFDDIECYLETLTIKLNLTVLSEFCCLEITRHNVCQLK